MSLSGHEFIGGNGAGREIDDNNKDTKLRFANRKRRVKLKMTSFRESRRRMWLKIMTEHTDLCTDNVLMRNVGMILEWTTEHISVNCRFATAVKVSYLPFPFNTDKVCYLFSNACYKLLKTYEVLITFFYILYILNFICFGCVPIPIAPVCFSSYRLSLRWVRYTQKHF